MNKADEVEAALEWIELVNTSMSVGCKVARILAAEVRRLQKINDSSDTLLNIGAEAMRETARNTIRLESRISELESLVEATQNLNTTLAKECTSHLEQIAKLEEQTP